MKRIELSIGTRYVKDWGISEALREIIQNAIDQESRDSENKWSCDITNDIITISNKTSKLTKSSLILGGTDKDNEERTIGQFGEGYKLALLVLLRAGVEVVIHNHHEKEVWMPKLIHSKVFNTEVLAIDIDKSWFSKPDKNLTFVLHGVEKAQSVLDSIMLNRYKNYNSIDTSYGKIFLDGTKGNIYVNGLFVCNKPNLKYSYSIKPNHLKIGRDRNLVSDWDILYKTSAMWQEAYSGNSLRIIDDIEKRVEDVKHILYHVKHIGSHKHSAGTLVGDISEKYKGKVPISSEIERDLAIKKYGEKVQTIITSPIIVELTKNSITVREVPTVNSKELLENFYSRHKKQFTKEMRKSWSIIEKEM